MAIDIKIPELGDGIDSAEVVKILVKPGDKIEPDQIIIELETDKANMEIPSETSGTIKEIKVRKVQLFQLVK